MANKYKRFYKDNGKEESNGRTYITIDTKVQKLKIQARTRSSKIKVYATKGDYCLGDIHF